MRPVYRNEDGYPDKADPLVTEIDRLAAESLGVDGASAADLAALLKVAVEARYWELVNAIVSPQTEDYAPHHRTAWNWFNDIGDEAPRPLVMCLARGGGKSTTLEMMLTQVALSKRRNYCLYIQSTQSGAEGKVSDVGERLAAPVIAKAFPDVASTFKTAKGTSRDWRKARIRTQSGFTLDALGMDQAIRGNKVFDDRPGMIVLDDLDERHDSPRRIQKKIEIITHNILESGAKNLVVVFIQNKIHDGSIMAKLLDGTADFLAERITIGPIPEVYDLEYVEQEPSDADPRRYVITGGRPSWDGVTLKDSEAALNSRGGPAAFQSEKQHVEYEAEGSMFPSVAWQRVRTDPTVMDWSKGLCRSWDLASTEGGGDWTAGVLLGADRDLRPWVIHVERFQREVADVERAMLEAAEIDEEDFGFKVPMVIELQPAAAGKWTKAHMETRFAGWPMFFMPPKGRKETRADPWASEVQRKRVHMVTADWNGPYMREHGSFPAGRHDDMVDASSQGWNWLASRFNRKTRGVIETSASNTTM